MSVSCTVAVASDAEDFVLLVVAPELHEIVNTASSMAENILIWIVMAYKNTIYLQSLPGHIAGYPVVI